MHVRQGVTHRDLKSENILLASKDQDDLRVKIVDFGFAAYLDPKKALDDYLGSPIFLAPEIYAGKSYNEKVDIWSLGVIAYEALSGATPFDAPNVQALKTAVLRGKFSFSQHRAFKNASHEVKDFIKCCLTLNPDERYSAEQLLAHPWIKDVSLSSLREKCENKGLGTEIDSLCYKTTQAS